MNKTQGSKASVLLCALTFAGILTTSAEAKKFQILHAFTGGSDGGYPFMGLLRNENTGDLYGTTVQGGGGRKVCTGGCGVIFKLTPDGTETVVHSFKGDKDGAYPYSELLSDALTGDMYGGTQGGGKFGFGVIFKLASTGQYSVVYNFTGGANGANPSGKLAMDSAHNLYGAAYNGGSFDRGAIFKLTSGGSYSVLHSFNEADGNAPYSGVTIDAAGNLYGTTTNGGSEHIGVIYTIAPDGTFKVLHNFTGGRDGAVPYSGVIKGVFNGDLFGATNSGDGSSSGGVVYRLNPRSRLIPMHTFKGGIDSFGPSGGDLFTNNDGRFYGTTVNGNNGSCDQGCGIIYTINWDGSGYQVVHTFTGGDNDGDDPQGHLIDDSIGNLFGTTVYGGPNNAGTIFVVQE